MTPSTVDRGTQRRPGKHASRQNRTACVGIQADSAIEVILLHPPTCASARWRDCLWPHRGGADRPNRSLPMSRYSFAASTTGIADTDWSER